MATVIEAPVMSDDLWNALFVNHPESCRLHHCWTNECPAGTHVQPVVNPNQGASHGPR